ncbi:MAG: KH domain-containing protein [Syntrophobacteraceae bacterium]
MRELVEYLVKSLVANPEEVVLMEQENEGTVYMELKIAPDDVGKIIGKNGNTINAIRTIVQAAASSHRKRAKLDVIGSS